MDEPTLLLILTVLLILLLLLRITRRRLRLPSSLPFTTPTMPLSTPKVKLEDTPSEPWEWGYEYAWWGGEVWTSGWNSWGEKWLAGLSPGRRKLVERIYDIGVPITLVSMIIGVLLIAISAAQSWTRLAWLVILERSSLSSSASSPAAVSHVGAALAETTMAVAAQAVKRAFTDQSEEPDGATGEPLRVVPAGAVFKKYELPELPEGGRGNLIEPLIPGLTLPLSHLPPLILSLLLSQVIHELGHLISSALLLIRPTRIGVRFVGFFAAAFVALPAFPTSSAYNSNSLEEPQGLGTAGVLVGAGVGQGKGRDVQARLRTAAAGPWHNLGVWALLALVMWTGVGGLVMWDYGADGRIVLGFNDGKSPLKGHLPVGAVIQYIDDLYIGGSDDTWGRYLLDERGNVDESRGWCVDRKRYAATLQPPCPPSASIRFSTLPFTNSSATHCLPAYPLLTTRTWPCPCSSSSQICVAPLASEGILRIQWVENGRERMRKRDRGSSVLLWMGGRREVWEGVRVGRYAGRGGAVGRWVVGWWELFFVYLSTLSLTLGLLNLLPLPHLDGAHILAAVLDILYPSTVAKALPTLEEGLASGQGFNLKLDPTPASTAPEIQVEPPTASTIDGNGKVREADLDRPIVQLTDDQITRLRIERIMIWGTGGAVAAALGGMIVTMAVERW